MLPEAGAGLKMPPGFLNMSELGKKFEEISALAEGLGRELKLMEVCGTHTVAAFRSGLRSRLPTAVKLLSGPGCPVCVTADAWLDRAITFALSGAAKVRTFGDMLRVPGTAMSLEHARAQGADIEVAYSPIDAVAEAAADPEHKLVFLAVGFETTAPAVAWTVEEARRRGLKNYFVSSALKTMPPALKALLEGGEVRLDGLLCPGHVSTIIGARVYDFIPRRYGIPCVVAGFEPMDMAEAVAMLLRMIREGRPKVLTQYTRAVTDEGNTQAWEAVIRVFEPCDMEWRGFGVIPGSGLKLRDEFGEYDAERLFPAPQPPPVRQDSGCRCGDVLRGALAPEQCPLFGRACAPHTPKGPCMVSSEGACAARYRYGRKPGAAFL